MKDKNRNNGIAENHTTKYGEMVPTNFGWIGIEEQKKKANKLANVGKETKNKDKK